MFETPLRSLLAFVMLLTIVLVAGFVFNGNGDISLERRPMPDDYSDAEIFNLLNPLQSGDEMPQQTGEASPLGQVDDPMNYVLWLNVSGFRPDYVEKATTPFFDEITSRGYFTKRLIPAFPTLRWPSLVSQATGASADVHQVICDTMRDPETGSLTTHPFDLASLGAEPIWTTAKRQGIRVLVHDWPFSQQQPAQHTADAFLDEINPALDDTERLKILLDAWAKNAGEGKERIRLIMASLAGLDQAARKSGCRMDETYQVVKNLDTAMSLFFDELKEKWTSELARNGDRLLVILSTDRGMVDVTKLVNLKELIADDMKPYAQIAFSDAMGHVWVQNLPDGVTMDLALTKIQEAMGERIYWDIYRREAIPEEWKLGSGPKIGDLVIQLKSGYAFTDESGPEAVFAPAEVSGPFAAAGLTVRSSSRMRGLTWIFELTEHWEPVAGDEFDATRLHATVCRILGIEPSESANPEALEIGL